MWVVRGMIAFALHHYYIALGLLWPLAAFLIVSIAPGHKEVLLVFLAGSRTT